MNILDMIPMKGKRTYVVGVLMVLYGVSGLILGNIDQQTAVQSIGTGFGMIFLRKGMESPSA